MGGACVRLDIRDALRAVLRQRRGDDAVHLRVRHRAFDRGWTYLRRH